MGNTVKNNISGKIIGDWNILDYLGKGYYNCKCNICGFEKRIQSWSLLHNQSLKCSEHNEKNTYSLVGKKIYEWEVLDKSNEYGKLQCKCSCGKIVNVSKARLLEGRTKSCGHASYGGITQNKFGKLTIIEYDSDKKRWLCQCECGNTEYWRLRDLRNNKRQLCCDSCKETKLIDLTNQSFGNWRVVSYAGNSKWNTICKCGRTGVIRSEALRNGTSNGCKWCAGKGFIDLTGQRFGKLYVKEYIGKSRFRCLCDCGNETIVSGGDLRYRKESKCTECANNRLEDITGKKFGHWTVLNYIGNGYWQCICDCNNKTISEVHAYTLKHNMTKSCGCDKKNQLLNTMLSKYGEISYTKFNNPRDNETLNIFINDEKFIEYIKSLSTKPTVVELTERFNVTVTVILKKIHMLNLDEYVKINSGSRYENEILNYIIQLDNSILVEKHNKLILNGQEIDIYIPEKRLGIEVNGSYWHSDLYKDKKYHQDKTIKAAKNGVRLIHIFEHEWIENKDKIKKIIKQKILDNTKIYARNTIVKTISNSDVKDLYNKNHLQNHVNSKINIGCYYNDKLIGAMSVSIPRFSNDAKYELTRLCWDSNYNVIGGTEKLFKYIINNYDIDELTTYVDISKFTGNVYTRLGFKVDESVKITEPNYVWVYKDNTGFTVYNRYKTQKHKLLKQGLEEYGSTEDEIMRNLGFMKIYDSGNLKLKWNK